MTQIWKRSISMFLALVMVFGMMPMNAFASETEETASAAEFSQEETTVLVETEALTVAAETEPVQTEAPAVSEETEPAQTEAPAVSEETEPAQTEAPAVSEETEPAQTEAPAVSEETEPAQTEAPVVPEETQAAVVEVAPVVETVSDPAMGESEQEVTEETAEPAVVEVEPVRQHVAPETEYTNEDMFHMYLDRQFFGENAVTLGTGGYDNLPEGAPKELYTYLKQLLKNIAGGGGSTAFTLEGEAFAAIGFKTDFTLEEVDLDAWPSTDDGNRALLSKFMEANGLANGVIIDALLADCPYELYWYDKTTGSSSGFGWSYITTDGVTTAKLTKFVIDFAVASGYGSNYAVDSTAAEKASAAAANAKEIAVSQKKDSDYETLKAYSDWIIEAVDYNTDAAAPEYDGGYGDPWQLIYVFDQNADTKVVCEGYSKAFQYLCDLALQEGYLAEETVCYLASGTATGEDDEGGAHMWNIVTLEDNNYLVDVTNSEESTFGEDGSLFLAGAQGSVEAGYTFTNSNGSKLTYVYYITKNDVTTWPSLEAYGEGAQTILTLAETAYVPSEGGTGEETPSEPETEMPVNEDSLRKALEGAAPGDTIFLTVDVALTQNLTVPAGVFLAIDGAALSIENGVSLVVSAGTGINPYNGASITVNNGGKLVLEGPKTDEAGNEVAEAGMGVGWDSVVTIAAGGTLDNNGTLDIGGTLNVESGATYVHGSHAAIMENGTINGIAKNLIDRYEGASAPEEIFAGMDNLRMASNEYKRKILFINHRGESGSDGTITINGDLNILEGILVRVGTRGDVTTNLVVNGTMHIQNMAQVQLYSNGTLTVNQLNNWGELYVSGDGSAYVNNGNRTLGNMVAFEQFTQANFEKDLRQHLNGGMGYVLTEELTLTDNLTIRTGWNQNFMIGTGGRLTVPAGKTLTIQEGEIVLVGEGELTVNGTLVLTEDTNMDDGDSGGYLIVDENGTLNINSQGNTIPSKAVGVNVTTEATVNGIENTRLLGLFYADDAASAEEDVYAALAKHGTYAQVNVYLFHSATLNGEGEENSKRLVIPENAYLILHAPEAPVVATVPAGTTLENNGLIIIRENASLVVEQGAAIENNNKINNFGALYLDAAECLSNGENGLVQNNPPLLPDSEQIKPYLSYTWVENWGDGFFENENSRGEGNLHMAAGDEYAILFYLNTWNSERMAWEKTPVIPKSSDTSVLSVIPVNGQIQQGQTNAPYFVSMKAKAWAPEGITLTTHDVGTGTDITTTVYISRSVAGFYREQPILSGENQMTEDQLREIYMSHLEIDPSDPETWTFYFALDCYEWIDGDTVIPWMPAEGSPVFTDGGSYVTMEPVEGEARVYKVTVDGEYAKNAWTDGSFGFLQVVCEAEVTIGEGETATTKKETFYGNLGVSTKNVAEAAASFSIDDEEYRVLRQGVYMQWSDHGPVLVNLPTGISYDLETNTMTLNGANVHHLQFNYHWEWEGNSGTSLPNENLTLELVGENKIEALYTEALGLYGGVHLTIAGDGSLYMKADNGLGHENEYGPYGFDTVNLGENSSLTIDSGSVTVEIAGKAYYWDDERGQLQPRNLAAIRGNGGTLTINGGSLTTVLPEGARSHIYNEFEEVTEDVGYSGLEHFRSVTVNGGTLHTSTLDMHRDDENQWRGTYTQTDGTVVIDAIAGLNYRQLNRWDEETGENVYWKDGYHYHYEGLNSWGDVNISGGDLTIRVQPTYAERSESSDFNGISMNGAELNISGNANIVIDSSVSDQQTENDNNGGTGVGLRDAYNQWGDHIGDSTFTMTGGTLTMNTPDGFMNDFLDVYHEGRARITGGKIVSRNNRSYLNGDVYFGGNAQWDMSHCGVEVGGRFELNETAVMNFMAGSQFEIFNEAQIFGGTLNFGSLDSNKVAIFHSYGGNTHLHDGTLNFDNGSLLVHDSMDIHGGTINITHNKAVERTEEYNPFWECYHANSAPFALLVKAYLAIHGGEININVESDQYAGITNWGNYHQMGGNVTVNGNVNDAPKTTGKAMYDIGNTMVQNDAVLNLYGDVAYHLSPADEGSLSVSGNAVLNAYGQSVGLELEGHARFDDNSCVNAFASGVPTNGIEAVKITDNQIWVENGNHTFQATNTSEQATDAQVIGLAIYENAKVVVNNGKVDVYAELPVYSIGGENKLDQNEPYLIMDHENGDKLFMKPVTEEESGFHVLKNELGDPSGSVVTIYGSASCGNAAGWNIEEDYETDDNGETKKADTRLAIGGNQYLNGGFDMSGENPEEWITPEWYRYKEFLTHIYVSGVWNLPAYIFGDLSQVTRIDIEGSVTEIDANAFAGCTSLETVCYAGTEAQWNAAFSGTLPEGCELLFNNGGEETYYAPVGISFLDNEGWGWMERQTENHGGLDLGVGDDRYVIFYRNITSTTEVPDGMDGTRTVTVLEDRIPIHPDHLFVSDPSKLELRKIAELEDESVADNERNGEYFVRIKALDGWDSTVNISCLVDAENGVTETFPVEIRRNEDAFYTSATPSNETWMSHFWMNPLMTEEDRTFYFIFDSEDGRKLRPAEDGASFFSINYGEDYLESWGPVEGKENAYAFTLKQDVIENCMLSGTNFELQVSYDVVDADGNQTDSGKLTSLWVHSGFNAERSAYFEIDGTGYEYYNTNGYKGFVADCRKAALPEGMTFEVDDDGETVILTLEDMILEDSSLRLSHHWVERDEWGNIRYDENGNAISGVDLPYEKLNIVLKGSNTIESSERKALELTGGLKVNISGDGSLLVKTNNTYENANEAIELSDESELTISGNAQVVAQVDGASDDFLAAIRGCETGKLILTDNAQLKTILLPGAYDHDHRGLERFASITVEENAKLNTQGIYLAPAWEMGTEYAGEYIQTGGEVTIYGHMNRHDDGNAYVSGIQGRVGSVISVTGGKLIIDTMPEGEGEFNSDNFSFSGISSEGGTIEIGGNAQVDVKGWHRGDMVYISGWGEEKGVFRMTGGTLNTVAHGDGSGYFCSLNIDWGCDAQISGGTMDLYGRVINIRSDLTFGAGSVLNTNCQFDIDNGVAVALDGGAINFNFGSFKNEAGDEVMIRSCAMNLHPGSTFNLESGTIEAPYGEFYIGGEFNINGGTLTIAEGDFHADNILNVNGGELVMSQEAPVYMTHDGPHTSQLSVSGQLNLNGGEIALTNTYVDVHHQLNLNGGQMTIGTETIDSEERRSNDLDDDWQVAMRIHERAQMNVRAGSFTMNGANFETILEVYGEYNQNGGAVKVRDLAPELTRADGSTWVDHADNTIVMAKGGNITGGSLTAEGGMSGILVHFSYGDERTYTDGSRLMISGDANVDIDAVEVGINMARPVVISGGNVDIDIKGIVYEISEYQQYVHCGYGILASGQEIDASLTISGGTVNIDVPTVFDESQATNKTYKRYTDLLGIFGARNSINISGGVVHITAADSLLTRNTEFRDLMNIVGMNVIDNQNGNVLKEVYGSVVNDAGVTMYFRTFQSDNQFGTGDPDVMFDAADSITIASAASGDGTYWSYDGQTKILKIYGSGQMADFASPSAAPWYAFARNIAHVEVADSITGIGSYAFAGCSGVKEISLSGAITSIGAGAFQGSSGLTVKVFHNTAAEDYVKKHNLGMAYRHDASELILAEGSNLYECAYCDYVQVGQVNEETPVEEILTNLNGTNLTEADTQALKDQMETALVVPSADNTATADLIATLDQKLQDETELTVEVTSRAGEAVDVTEVLGAPENAAQPSIVGAAMNADSNTTTVSLVIDQADVTTEDLQENLENSIKPVTVFTMTLEKTQAGETESEKIEDLQIPVTITIPIPENVGGSLKVLHYAGGTEADPEIITPVITTDASSNRYATFVVSGFSTYALAESTEITIQIDSEEVNLGAKLPDLTYKLLDEENNEVTESLKDELKVVLTTAAKANAAGKYPIKVKSYNTRSAYSLTNAGTEIGYVTVAKQKVNVTIENKAITVGDALPELTYTTNVKDLDIKLTTNADPNVAGKYDITAELGENPNYDITVEAGMLTVNKRAVTVQLSNVTLELGAQWPESFVYSVEGVDASQLDIAVKVMKDQTEVTNADNAGEFVITAEVTGKAAENYNITVNDGELTVNKKTVSITIDDKSAALGDTMPELTYTINTDGVEKDDLNITLNAENDTGTAGTHKITATLGENPNYDITVAEGTLTVYRRSITVTFEDVETELGVWPGEFPYSVTNVTGLNVPVKVVDTDGNVVENADNAGTYTITVDTDSMPNYVVTVNAGTLTVISEGYTVDIAALEAAYDAEVELWVYAVIPDEMLAADNAYVEITKASAFDGPVTTQVTAAQLREQGKTQYGDYRLSTGMASGEMTKGVTFKFYDGDGNLAMITDKSVEVGTEATYTILDYVDRVLEKGTDKQKDIVPALVTYGGYAQVYFGSKYDVADCDKENPAYNILSKYGIAIPSLSGVSADSIQNVITTTDETAGIKYNGTEAYLDSAIYQRVYFLLTGEEGISDYTFELTYPDSGGNLHKMILNPVKSGSEYYVDIPDIPAAYLDHDYVLTVTNTADHETYTVTISTLAWMKLAMNKYTDEKHVNMLKAMYLYNQAANEFFGK